MMSSHPYHSPLMTPSPMSYVINSPVANAVLKSTIELANENLPEQLNRIEDENRSLQRRLHNKTLENNKLQQRIDKIEGELQSYRHMLEQINHRIANGETPSINLAIHHQSMMTESKDKLPRAKKSKKVANHQHQHQSCQCCSVTEKPHLCDFPDCGKRFRQKPHLEAHRNIHTGRRFSCHWPGCGKSFMRKYNLVEHAKMHTNGNQNLCTFPECGKIFSSKYSLVRHQNAQHA